MIDTEGKSLTKKEIGSETHLPIVLQRPEHSISRKHISSAAVRVLYGLREAGYQAHLVGGAVRDALPFLAGAASVVSASGAALTTWPPVGWARPA